MFGSLGNMFHIENQRLVLLTTGWGSPFKSGHRVHRVSFGSYVSFGSSLADLCKQKSSARIG